MRETPRKVRDNAMCVWDFTSFNMDLTKDDIIKILKEHCKKWTFQKEHTKDMKLHWQGRFSLKVKKRASSITLNLGHYSITSNANRDNDFYACKQDSHVEGPWKDTDEVRYIPRQVAGDVKLKEWQQTIIEQSKVWNDRIIDCVYCPQGNIGKSFLCTYMHCHHLANRVPSVSNYQDLMQMVMCMKTAKVYLFDMPRALNKSALHEMYGAIETIKDGYAFDKRYTFKEKNFDSPNVWVFTNELPDRKLLSHDRWRFWEVRGDKLVKQGTPMSPFDPIGPLPIVPPEFMSASEFLKYNDLEDEDM